MHHEHTGLITRLRKKALNTLEESSELFELAFFLLRKGKVKEAEKTKQMARLKRNNSGFLMRKANNLEKQSLAPHSLVSLTQVENRSRGRFGAEENRRAAH